MNAAQRAALQVRQKQRRIEFKLGMVIIRNLIFNLPKFNDRLIVWQSLEMIVILDAISN